MEQRYRITVQEQLAVESDASWLDGIVISFDARGHTRLDGKFSDQAALVGLLLRLHHLNLTLLSVSGDDDVNNDSQTANNE